MSSSGSPSSASAFLSLSFLVSAGLLGYIFYKHPSWKGFISAFAVAVIVQTIGFLVWRKLLDKSRITDGLAEGLTVLSVLLSGAVFYTIAMALAFYYSDPNKDFTAFVKGLLAGMGSAFFIIYISLLLAGMFVNIGSDSR